MDWLLLDPPDLGQSLGAPWWAVILAAVVGPLIASSVTVYVSRRQTRVEGQRVQVDAAEVKVSASETDRKRILDLEQRVDLLERDRENDRDYIATLKGHIWDRKPPPPPPRPRRSDTD